MFSILRHMFTTWSEDSSTSPACTPAFLEISSNALLMTFDAPVALFAFSSNRLPDSARLIDISCKCFILPSSLSKNAFRLFPNKENSSFPFILTLVKIFPLAMCSSVFLNSFTFLSIFVPMTSVINISTIAMSPITTALMIYIRILTSFISFSAVSLIVSQSDASLLLIISLSAFNCRI